MQFDDPTDVSANVAKVLQRDICGSAINVIGIPLAELGPPQLFLVSPGGREFNSAGGLAWARPTVYVLDGQQGLAYRYHSSLCANVNPFTLNLEFLRYSLARRRFVTLAKSSQQRFRRGMLVKKLAKKRLSIWEHHVRLSIEGAHRFGPKGIGARTRKFFSQVTRKVLHPLISAMRSAENELVADWLSDSDLLLAVEHFDDDQFDCLVGGIALDRGNETLN